MKFFMRKLLPCLLSCIGSTSAFAADETLKMHYVDRQGTQPLAVHCKMPSIHESYDSTCDAIEPLVGMIIKNDMPVYFAMVGFKVGSNQPPLNILNCIIDRNISEDRKPTDLVIKYTTQIFSVETARIPPPLNLFVSSCTLEHRGSK